MNGGANGFTSSEHSSGLQLRGGNYISALAYSPVDHERWYFATSNGRFYYSEDHAVTWTQSENNVADDNWYYGQAIAPSWTDPDVVTVGGSGYGVPAVYRTEDGGYTFFPWGDGLPDTLIYGMVEAMDGTGCVYAGGASSAYRRCPEDEEWTDIADGEAPVTIYWSVEALPHENTLRFATYGRGIWDLELETPECYPVVDADEDGSYCHEDCDDDDPDVNPEATEVVGDGIDQDCDGEDTTNVSASDTDEPATDAPALDDTEEEIGAGCGCSGTGGASGWWLLPLVVMWRRRS